jgi:uncharacterized protein (TIGR04562 family)
MASKEPVYGVPVREPVYHFPWQTLDAIIAGRSAIDLEGLRLTTVQAANEFIASYGYNVTDAADGAEMAQIWDLSAAFIATSLLPYAELTHVPFELPHEYPDLLLIASTPDHPLRNWACSFLRVSHAVVHARYGQDMQALENGRIQLLEHLKPHLVAGAAGTVVSDGEMTIPLVRLDLKREKPWESLVLKLLHKVDNVATEVYDHLGLRFVTPDKAYALLLLKYFRLNNLFCFANIKPSRSLNTLIDLLEFKSGFQELDSAYLAGELSFKAFQSAVHKLGTNPDTGLGRNPHSDQGYQTMQFTARMMVRATHGDTITRTFVPFEVQIMDEAAYHANRAGKAEHGAYRERQRLAVCRRVFPWALPNDT